MDSSALPTGAPNPHRLADERSIALHAAIVAAIDERPDVLEGARSRVDLWLRDGTVHRAYSLRWKELLSLPSDRLAARLVDPGEEMRAMRQCSPFAGALDPRTRWRILEETTNRLAER